MDSRSRGEYSRSEVRRWREWKRKTKLNNPQPHSSPTKNGKLRRKPHKQIIVCQECQEFQLSVNLQKPCDLWKMERSLSELTQRCALSVFFSCADPNVPLSFLWIVFVEERIRQHMALLNSFWKTDCPVSLLFRCCLCTRYYKSVCLSLRWLEKRSHVHSQLLSALLLSTYCKSPTVTLVSKAVTHAEPDSRQMEALRAYTTVKPNLSRILSSFFF